MYILLLGHALAYIIIRPLLPSLIVYSHFCNSYQSTKMEFNKQLLCLKHQKRSSKLIFLQNHANYQNQLYFESPVLDLFLMLSNVSSKLKKACDQKVNAYTLGLSKQEPKFFTIDSRQGGNPNNHSSSAITIVIGSTTIQICYAQYKMRWCEILTSNRLVLCYPLRSTHNATLNSFKKL